MWLKQRGQRGESLRSDERRGKQISDYSGIQLLCEWIERLQSENLETSEEPT